MSIVTERNVAIMCDNCSNQDVDSHRTQREAIKRARLMGWSIGKRIICPECLAEGKVITEIAKRKVLQTGASR